MDCIKEPTFTHIVDGVVAVFIIPHSSCMKGLGPGRDTPTVFTVQVIIGPVGLPVAEKWSTIIITIACQSESQLSAPLCTLFFMMCISLDFVNL